METSTRSSAVVDLKLRETHCADDRLDRCWSFGRYVGSMLKLRMASQGISMRVIGRANPRLHRGSHRTWF